MKLMKKKLSNGITVIFEKRELPLVAASITNKFGAAHEPSNIKGIAHFMEHLVFTGTKTRTHEDISREIEKRGGILNAFTTNEVTSFWFKLPSNHLFAGFDILVDMLSNPLFKPDKFEKEKKVILEEIKMYHDDPQKSVYDKIQENLYKAPFGEGVIGSEKTIKPLKRDFVADYFSRAYNPSNFIVTVVGDADFDKICSYFESAFKKSRENKVPVILPVKTQAKETVEKRNGIDQANFIFAIHAPTLAQKDYTAFEVLNAYLADGMSSHLFLKIREERGLAYTVRGYISGEKNYSYYSIYAGTTKEAIPEVQKLILEGFKSARDINQAQLDEAKEKLVGARKLAREDSVNVMNELAFTEIIAGDAGKYYSHDEEINAVTLEQVHKLARVAGYSTAAIIPA